MACEFFSAQKVCRNAKIPRMAANRMMAMAAVSSACGALALSAAAWAMSISFVHSGGYLSASRIFGSTSGSIGAGIFSSASSICPET
jgi:hypothetical protein